MVRSICKCLNKVMCICNSVLTAPSKNRREGTSRRDLEEWRRVGGIDRLSPTLYDSIPQLEKILRR